MTALIRLAPIVSPERIIHVLAKAAGDEDVVDRMWSAKVDHLVPLNTKEPARLRDLRRARGRGLKPSTSPGHAALVLMGDALARAAYPGADVAAALDRLISRYGPDALVEEIVAHIVTARPSAERTNHKCGCEVVAPTSCANPNAATHGGDGNSGECNSAAHTAADDRQSVSDTACDAGGTGDTPDGPSSAKHGQDGLSDEASWSEVQDAASGDAAEQPTGQGDCGGDEPTEGMGSQTSAPAGDGDQGPLARGELSAKADAEQARDDHRAAGYPSGGDADSPATNQPEQGSGSYLDTEAAEAALRDARQAHAARRLVAALRKVVESTCAPSGTASPRYDGRRLVRELISRRYALNRALRDERGIKDVVIAVDVSGSCASTCDAAYGAALQAASILPRDRVAIITHSNGLGISSVEDHAPAWLTSLLSKHSDGLRAHYYSDAHNAACDAVWAGIAARRPGIVIVLGDMDSSWAHDILHKAGVKVLLMTWAKHENMRLDAPYTVVPGVVDTVTAADGLEAAIAKGGLI